LLQQGSLEGHVVGPAGIRADQLSDAVFDYIFLQKDYAAAAQSGIPETVLQRLRKEFEFWYPVDLRVSGKDLIGNHLTMSLYNHSAIWVGFFNCFSLIILFNSLMILKNGHRVFSRTAIHC
jgi:leucyl-tRNA synthetase